MQKTLHIPFIVLGKDYSVQNLYKIRV